MVLFRWTPNERAMAVACFVVGATLFAIGAHLSYVNVAPQQTRIKAQSDFVRDILEKRQQTRDAFKRQELEERKRKT